MASYQTTFTTPRRHLPLPIDVATDSPTKLTVFADVFGIAYEDLNTSLDEPTELDSPPKKPCSESSHSTGSPSSAFNSTDSMSSSSTIASFFRRLNPFRAAPTPKPTPPSQLLSLTSRCNATTSPVQKFDVGRASVSVKYLRPAEEGGYVGDLEAGLWSIQDKNWEIFRRQGEESHDGGYERALALALARR